MNSNEVLQYALKQAKEATEAMVTLENEVREASRRMDQFNKRPFNKPFLNWALIPIFFVIGFLFSWIMAFLLTFALWSYIFIKGNPLRHELRNVEARYELAVKLNEETWQKYSSLCETVDSVRQLPSRETVSQERQGVKS